MRAPRRIETGRAALLGSVRRVGAQISCAGAVAEIAAGNCMAQRDNDGAGCSRVAAPAFRFSAPRGPVLVFGAITPWLLIPRPAPEIRVEIRWLCAPFAKHLWGLGGFAYRFAKNFERSINNRDNRKVTREVGCVAWEQKTSRYAMETRQNVE